jgi:DNA polymerase alpha subunit B
MLSRVLQALQHAHAVPCLPALPPLQVAYLERRIMAGEEAAEQLLGLEAHPVAMAAQETCLFVGRVCCDSEGGRLNPQSLLLEGSMRRSQGARVRLDVSKCPSFRLFPGQVVALRGTNPSGHCVVASQLLPGLAQPLPRSSLATLAGHAAVTGRGGQSVVVAAGPFTSSEDLEYAPLGALLHYCAQPQHRPDLLLLVGPFVDAEHPLIQGGLVEEAFEHIYSARVSEAGQVLIGFIPGFVVLG